MLEAGWVATGSYALVAAQVATQVATVVLPNMAIFHLEVAAEERGRDAMEDLSASPVDASVEPPAKKKKGAKGLPPGIVEHNSGNMQARLIGAKVDGKAGTSGPAGA